MRRFDDDYYEYLRDYGISSPDDPFYRINDLPLFKEMLEGEETFFIGMKGWLVSKKDDREYIRNYDIAVRVINLLINADR